MRQDWLDVLKCIAMFAVIVGHASTGETPDTLRYYIYAFHMPLFFIISGMTYNLQMKKRHYTFPELLKNKSKTLLWPYLIFNLLVIPLWAVYFVLFPEEEGSIVSLLVSTAYSNPTWSSLPISASWFLTTLFLTTLLFYGIVRASKKKNSVIFGVSAAAGLLGYGISLVEDINLLYPWHISTVPVACFLFMLGYMFMEYRDRIDKVLITRKMPVWILLAGGLGYIAARYNVKITMGLNHYGNFILFAVSVAAFSLAFYMISRIIPPFGVLKLIGRNTVVYLCTHELLIIAMTVLSSSTAALVSNHVIIASLIIFIVLIPVAYIVERWLPLLIGRRKKK